MVLHAGQEQQRWFTSKGEQSFVRGLEGTVPRIETDSRAADAFALRHKRYLYRDVQIPGRWPARFINEALLWHVHPAHENEIGGRKQGGEFGVDREGIGAFSAEAGPAVQIAAAAISVIPQRMMPSSITSWRATAIDRTNTCNRTS